MVGLFPSFLHPPESFSLASKGWPTAKVGGTPPKGFQRLGIPLEGGTGTEDSLSLRTGRGLAGLVTLPPSGSADSDWGSLALVAASGSGTPLLPLERLQVALATGTLRLRSACLVFPVSVATARKGLRGAGGGASSSGGRSYVQLSGPAGRVPLALPGASSHLQTEWAQKLSTLESAEARTL